MATCTVCDGCRAPVESPHTRGWIRPRAYCDVCVALADAYTGALNAAHSTAAAVFDKLERAAADDARAAGLAELPL